MAAFYLPYQFTSTLLPSTNDPTVSGYNLLLENNASLLLENGLSFFLEGTFVSGSPFGIDPEQTTLITVANTHPFGIDPEQTTLITAGLTASD